MNHSLLKHCGLAPVGGQYDGGKTFDISCASCELKTERCKTPEEAVGRWNNIVKRGYSPEDVEQFALYNKLMEQKRSGKDGHG